MLTCDLDDLLDLDDLRGTMRYLWGCNGVQYGYSGVQWAYSGGYSDILMTGAHGDGLSFSSSRSKSYVQKIALTTVCGTNSQKSLDFPASILMTSFHSLGRAYTICIHLKNKLVYILCCL